MRSLRVSCSVALVLAAAGCGDEGLGVVGGDDLAQSAAPGDLAGGSVDLASGGGDDLAGSIVDLAAPGPGPDIAAPAPDLAPARDLAVSIDLAVPTDLTV